MRAWRVHELGHPSTSLRLEDVDTGILEKLVKRSYDNIG